MNYKYRIGQRVMVQMYDRWMGDFEAPCVISQPENYVINAIPVYIVEKHTGETMGGVIETRITAEERK